MNSKNQLVSPEVDVEKMEPTSLTSFDVDITSNGITPEEKEMLYKCLRSTTAKKLVFGLYNIDDKVQPVEILRKLENCGHRFDVNISMLNTLGKTVGTIIYKACTISVDLTELFNFNYEGSLFQTQDQKEVTVELFPKSILYNDKEI